MTTRRYWHGHHHLPGGLEILPTRPGNVERLRERSTRFRSLIDEAYPHGLAGRSVLDVGCADGHFAVECAQAGATVLGVDSDEEEIAKARAVAARTPGLALEFATGDFSATDLPSCDIVLCLGLLYHLADPISALWRLQALTKDVLVVDTDVVPLPAQWIRVEWQGGKRWQRGESTLSPCLVLSAGLIDDVLAAAGFARIVGHGRPHAARQWDYRSGRRVMAAYRRGGGTDLRPRSVRPEDDGGRIFGWRYRRGTVAYRLVSVSLRVLEPLLHRWR